MNGLVLLSGGLDSAAALMQASRTLSYEQLDGVFFDYGQPASVREWDAAERIARSCGARVVYRTLREAFIGMGVGLLAGEPPEAGIGVSGRDRAFVPARNLVMLSMAASMASYRWGDAGGELIVGFNADDAAGFPDCRKPFADAVEQVIGLGGARNISVRAPWLNMTKGDVVRVVREIGSDSLELLRGTVSCYGATTDCDRCTGCVSRKTAFAALG